MNRKDNEIRRILQGPLGEGDHHWAEPGDHVWAGIEAALPEQKKRGGFWWWFGGALSLILLALFLIPNGTDSSSIAASEATTPLIQIPDQNGESNSTLQPSVDVSDSEELLPGNVKDQNSFEVVQDHANQKITSWKKQGNASLEKANTNSNATSSLDELNVNDPKQSRIEISTPDTPSESESELRANNSLPVQLTPIRMMNQIPSLMQEVVFQHVQELPLHDWAKSGFNSESKQSSVLKNPHHRLLIYGHGTGADRRIERKSNVNIFDPEFGHKNTQFRFGAGYEYQHKSGIFAGSGIEYQDFHEQVGKEKKWNYTKQNSTQVGSDLFQQNIPVVINSGFGTASTTLRVDIKETGEITDYKEGDPVAFKMTVDHSLTFIRIPVYIGYHYNWNRWFGEIRGGTGLQVYVGSKAQVTQVTEARGKIKMHQTEVINQLKHVRPAIWDLQGGLYAGYMMSDTWSISCGYEYWQSLQSLVDRPNVSTFTSGSGIQLALRRSF